jgi:hypothetical protein
LKWTFLWMRCSIIFVRSDGRVLAEICIRECKGNW